MSIEQILLTCCSVLIVVNLAFAYVIFSQFEKIRRLENNNGRLILAIHELNKNLNDGYEKIKQLDANSTEMIQRMIKQGYNPFNGKQLLQ